MRKLSVFAALLFCALAAPAQAQWLQVPQVDGLRLNDRVATSPCSVGQACLFRYGLTLQYQRTDGVVTTIGPVTLQQAYNNGGAGPSLLTEDATRLGIIIRQDVGATSDPVFAVQTNSGGTDLLNVNGSRVRIGKPILMDATGGNTITMSQSGIYSGNGPPTFTTVSAGEKLSLVSRIDGANTNLAIGVDATGGNGMWFGVSQAVAGDNFKWYGGTTLLLKLTGDKALTAGAAATWDTIDGTLKSATWTRTTSGTLTAGDANATTIAVNLSGTNRWSFTSTTFTPAADNAEFIGSNTLRLGTLYTLLIRSGDTALVDTTGSGLTLVSQAGGASSGGAAGSGGPIAITASNGGAASAAGAAGTGGTNTASTGGGGAGLAGTNGTSGGNGIAGGASGALNLATGPSGTSGAGGTGTSGAGGNGASGTATSAIGFNVGIASAGGAGGATTGGGAGGLGGTGGNAGNYGFAGGGTTRAGAGGVGGNTSTGGNAGAGGIGGTGGQFNVGGAVAANGGNGGVGGTASGGGSNGAGGNGGTGLAISQTGGVGGTGGQNGGAAATSGTGGLGGNWSSAAGAGGAGGAAGAGTQGNGGNGGTHSTSGGAGGSGLTGGSGGNWVANSGAGGTGGNTNSGDVILNVAAAGGAGTQGQFRWQNAGATIITLVPSTSTFTSATAGAANVGNSTNYFGTIYSRHFHGAGTAPTIAVGNAAQLGTGPAAAVTAGSDAGATVTLTTGTGPTAFVAATEVKLGTVSFNTTYSTAAPRAIVVTPAAALSGALATGANGINCYAKQSTTTTGQFDIFCVSSGTPTLAASTAYPYALVVIQ